MLLILLLIVLMGLYLKIVLKLEIKKSDIYPNGFMISTTTTKKMSEQELRTYIRSLQDLMAKGDAQALANLKLMADKGNNHYAQAILGMMYQGGVGVKKDLAKTFEYYTAAENYESLAQLNLGSLYEYGTYVKQDYVRAFELYKKATDSIDLNLKKIAQFNLANLFRQGLGTEQNIDMAIALYKQTIDTAELPKPLNPSLEESKTGSLTALGHLYRNKQEYDIARQYYIEAAERGNPSAATNVSYDYLRGFGVEKNIPKAIELFTFAAERGDPAAQNNLGTCYMDGLGVETNVQKAKQLFELSAKQGYEIAKQNLKKLEAR